MSKWEAAQLQKLKWHLNLSTARSLLAKSNGNWQLSTKQSQTETYIYLILQFLRDLNANLVSEIAVTGLEGWVAHASLWTPRPRPWPVYLVTMHVDKADRSLNGNRHYSWCREETAIRNLALVKNGNGFMVRPPPPQARPQPRLQDENVLAAITLFTREMCKDGGNLLTMRELDSSVRIGASW